MTENEPKLGFWCGFELGAAGVLLALAVTWLIYS